jgi:predicted RNA-binding protein
MRKTPDSARIRHAPKAASSAWLNDAEKAQKDIAGVARGQREKKLQELAGQYGVTANTLRRYLAAAAALPRISDKTGLPAESLGRLPLGTVEALGRWVEYDKRTATKMAKEAVNGDASVRDVVAGEVEARRMAGGKAGIPGKIVKTDLRKHLTKILQPPGTAAAPRDECRTEGVDLLFRNQDRQAVAVLIFGPYQDEQAYKQRRSEFVQRLIGLGLIYEKVVAVIPERERSELENILQNYREAVGRHSREAEKQLQRTLSFFHVR